MLTIDDVKEYLRIDTCEEDDLISSLMITAKVLVEEVLRYTLDEDEEIPEPITQAMLLTISTLYEERQVARSYKEGISVSQLLDTLRRLLFAYRKEKF